MLLISPNVTALATSLTYATSDKAINLDIKRGWHNICSVIAQAMVVCIRVTSHKRNSKCNSVPVTTIELPWWRREMETLSALLARSWWRRQKETFSALLAICGGNSPVPGEFPVQRPVVRGVDVFFDLRLNKCLSKQSWVGDLRCYRAHYDVTVMVMLDSYTRSQYCGALMIFLLLVAWTSYYKKAFRLTRPPVRRIQRSTVDSLTRVTNTELEPGARETSP